MVPQIYPLFNKVRSVNCTPNKVVLLFGQPCFCTQCHRLLMTSVFIHVPDGEYHNQKWYYKKITKTVSKEVKVAVETLKTQF